MTSSELDELNARELERTLQIARERAQEATELVASVIARGTQRCEVDSESTEDRKAAR